MEIAEVDAYSRARSGAEKDFKAEWEWWRYSVGVSHSFRPCCFRWSYLKSGAILLAS